jgi:GT2 family glycosyltransferase
MSPPSVAAVVLSYNGREIVLEALASLSRLEYAPLEIVLVDNGSTDGTYAAVGDAFPAVTRLRVEENRGISWGINHGIRHAIARGHDYLLLLNNDIEADPEMLRELVGVAEGDPEAGCVGPKTYYYWERDRLWSAGGILRFREAVTRERGMGEIDHGQYDRVEEVDYINGCCMLIPRRVMQQVGPWDPIYFVSVEDADWCMRMKHAGFRCIYTHRARLWHMVSRSTGGYRASRTFQTGRSTAIFVRRYATFRDWCRFLVFQTLALPAAFVREALRGNAGAVIAKARGLWAGLRVEMTPPPVLDATRTQD